MVRRRIAMVCLAATAAFALPARSRRRQRSSSVRVVVERHSRWEYSAGWHEDGVEELNDKGGVLGRKPRSLSGTTRTTRTKDHRLAIWRARGNRRGRRRHLERRRTRAFTAGRVPADPISCTMSARTRFCGRAAGSPSALPSPHLQHRVDRRHDQDRKYSRSGIVADYAGAFRSRSRRQPDQAHAGGEAPDGSGTRAREGLHAVSRKLQGLDPEVIVAIGHPPGARRSPGRRSSSA